MPYILEEDRERLTALNNPENPGELNYVITCICLLPEPINERQHKIRAAVDEYVVTRAPLGHPSYSLYNEIIGALECARLEHIRRTGIKGTVDDMLAFVKDSFYRQRVAPYEDQKIKDNGDVYA